MKKLLVVALMMLSSTPAWAGAGKRPEAEVRAEKWFKAGLEQTRTGNHQAALASFSAAYADVPSVDILWNLASTERRLGRTVSALEHLRAYLAHPNARSDRRPMATQWIEELSAEVGRVVVASSPSAEISVDGAPRAAGPIDLLPGIHTITVRCDDHQRSVAVDVAAGDVRDLSVPCDVPAPAAPRVEAPKAEPTRAAATQVVVVTKPASSARTWTVLGLTIGAAGAVAGGVIFSSLAAHAQGQADGAKVQLGSNGFSCKSSGTLCADYDDARARSTRYTGVSTGMFVLAGVTGGAAVASYLLWPKETETRIVPVVGKDAGAVSVSGTF